MVMRRVQAATHLTSSSHPASFAGLLSPHFECFSGDAFLACHSGVQHRHRVVSLGREKCCYLDSVLV